VEWEIEVTSDFEQWWDSLTVSEQEDVRACVLLLRKLGPGLPFPYSSSVTTSKHAHMRELRVQHAGRPYRVLYAFDPRRTAILLIGGKKTGGRRWYDAFVPRADRLYTTNREHRRGWRRIYWVCLLPLAFCLAAQPRCDEYLKELRKEGLIHG
jgi:hypothetical protein